MKTLFLMIVGCLIISTNPVYAQLTKTSKKAVSATAKQFAKEGWVLDGTGTFSTVLTSHYSKLDSGEVSELVGNASRKNSINMAKTVARNNAINEYAESARSMIRAKMTTDVKDVNDEQRENFAAEYERLVIKEMNGTLKTSFYMYKSNDDGTYNVRAFFLVDEKAMASVNDNAIQEAANEVGIAKENAQKVTELIK